MKYWKKCPARKRARFASCWSTIPAPPGGMMNPDFAFVGEGTTRDEVILWMREQDLNLDQLDTVVLLDTAAQFAGTVTVSRLSAGGARCKAWRNCAWSRC